MLWRFGIVYPIALGCFGWGQTGITYGSESGKPESILPSWPYEFLGQIFVLLSGVKLG